MAAPCKRIGGCAKLIKTKRQDKHMYTTSSEARLEVCEDLWRKGRYRVELTGRLAYAAGDVDAALEQLGYEAIDLDQWGRSYQHREDPSRTAELDELGEGAASVRLVLRQGNLEPSEIAGAKSELDLRYGRLYSTWQARGEQDFCQAPCPEDAAYGWPGQRQRFNSRPVRY